MNEDENEMKGNVRSDKIRSDKLRSDKIKKVSMRGTFVLGQGGYTQQRIKTEERRGGKVKNSR